MAETLGSLFDKLSIVKLKQFHSNDCDQLKSLSSQENMLLSEINEFITNACSGNIPYNRLAFAANKVYKKEGNLIENVKGSIGEISAKLASVNCELWHWQEKVYEFEEVPPDEKNAVIKKLALLNLERNKCIDEIDSKLQDYLRS